MGWFYVGQWTALTYPKETEAWELPLDGNLQHLTDTLAPEDLLVDPENMALDPAVTQYGDTLWGVVPDEDPINQWYQGHLNTDVLSTTWYVISKNNNVNNWYIGVSNALS